MKKILILILIVSLSFYANNFKSSDPVDDYCDHSASIGAERIESFVGCLTDAQYNSLYTAIFNNCVSNINGGTGFNSGTSEFDE